MMGVFLLAIVILDTAITAYLLGRRKQDKRELAKCMEEVLSMRIKVDAMANVQAQQLPMNPVVPQSVNVAGSGEVA